MVNTSAAVTTRMAPDVPIINVKQSGEAQPLPILLQAPSPTGRYQGRELRAGHLTANSLRNPLAGSLRSKMGGSCDSFRRRRAMVLSSHLQSCWLKRPVPEASEMLVLTSPKS